MVLVSSLRVALVAAGLAVIVAACGGPSHAGSGGTSVPSATTAALGPAPPASGGPGSAGTGSPASGASADWPTYDHDGARSGVDPSAPAAGHVQPAWTSPVLDGAVYAQPLAVGQTVLVATENNTVYAFDAATGARQWSRHLATPVRRRSLPCGNIDPSGITGTPVIDTTTGIVWVVTFSPPAVHTLWGLRLGTGAVVSARNADPPGADPRALQERGALALDGGSVDIPYGGLFGDCSDYHGWLVGLSAQDTSAPTKATFETAAARAGIWAPPGPVVAADGSVYVATGNGRPVDPANQAQSVLRLSSGLGVEDSFTDPNFGPLSSTDRDLGSTSPALLPGGLVFQIGKQGIGYLLAAGHLGGVGGFVAAAQICEGGFGGDAVAGDTVLVSCFDGLYAVAVTPAGGGTGPSLSVSWSATGFRPGPPVVAGGMVWVVEAGGVLAGFNVASGAAGYRHGIDVAGSFPSLAAGGGRLFVADGHRVAVFAGV
jgi:outer membrane protein assembly factor BamB